MKKWGRPLGTDSDSGSHPCRPPG